VRNSLGGVLIGTPWDPDSGTRNRSYAPFENEPPGSQSA
jgi:hypothetical protein